MIIFAMIILIMKTELRWGQVYIYTKRLQTWFCLSLSWKLHFNLFRFNQEHLLLAFTAGVFEKIIFSFYPCLYNYICNHFSYDFMLIIAVEFCINGKVIRRR